MKKKVALVTNWNEHCAVAEYAKNLVNSVALVDTDIEFRVIDVIEEGFVYDRTEGCDVIHFNYCAHAFKQWTNSSWAKMRPVPRIFTFHESSDWQTRRLAESNIADLYVIHDRLRDGMPQPQNVVTINFGVPEVSGLSEWVTPNTVGTFGCAFPWKALLPLAYACEQAGKQLKCWLSEPSAEDCKIDFNALKNQIWALHPKALIQTKWAPQETVIQELSTCEVLALPFDPAAPINGISASVRFALAAKRPLVLNRFHHYADLFDFDNEIYFVGENSGLQSAIEHASDHSKIQSAMIPHLVRKYFSWHNSARTYVSLYKTIGYVEAAGGKSTAVGQS